MVDARHTLASYNFPWMGRMISYGFYLIVAAILTGFIAFMSISKLNLSMKFSFLAVGIGLFLTIVIGAMQ